MGFAIRNRSARRIALAVGFTAVSLLECNCLFASEKDLKATDVKYGGDGMAVASGLVQKSKQSIEPLDANILKRLDSGEILSAEVSFSLKFGKYIKIDESLAADKIASILSKEVGIKDASKLKFTKVKAGFGESRYEAVVTIERKEKKEIDSISETLSKMENKTGDNLADMNEIDIDKLNDKLKEFASIKDSEDIGKLSTRISDLKKNRGEAVVLKEKRLKEEEAKKTAEKEALDKQKEQERIAKEAENKKDRYKELKEKSDKARVKEDEKIKKEAEKAEAERIKVAEKETRRKEEAAEKAKFDIGEAQRDKEFKEMVQKGKEEKARKLEEKAGAAAEKNKLKEMISKVEPIEAPKPVAPALRATVKPVSEVVEDIKGTELDWMASIIDDTSTKEASFSASGSESETSETFKAIKKAFGAEGDVIESDKIRILVVDRDKEGKRKAIKFVPK